MITLIFNQNNKITYFIKFIMINFLYISNLLMMKKIYKLLLIITKINQIQLY
jgi:hypothetical protein